MRRPAHAGRWLAALGLLLSTPTLAQAETGGAAVAAAPAAATTASGSGSSSGSIQSRPLTITRSQLRSVQRRIRLRADGVLGSKTRAALKRFQRRNGLTAHGQPSVETLRALGLKVADRYEARMTAAAAGPAGAAEAPLPGAVAGVAGALEAARSRIGDPYVYGGERPGGFDCSGLTVWAFAQAGITLPRTSFQQYKEGVAVPKAAIQAGDLVFFNSAGPGASHVGIATGPTRVISATTRGVMEHPITTGYWGARYVGARRITA